VKFDISASTKWQLVTERVVGGLTNVKQICPKTRAEMVSPFIVHTSSRVKNLYVALYKYSKIWANHRTS
jgi:hypothetical protein